MTIHQGFSVILCLTGGFFFLTGTIGLIRFPDTYSRLHALTKADNLGLGFMVLGLALVSGSIPETIKLGLTWFLALIGSSSACYFIGNYLHHSSKARDNKNDPCV
ncbi:MAG: monovalent cation/H(+) antiporter subunit G [Desulfonatronovibrio sp.]